MKRFIVLLLLCIIPFFAMSKERPYFYNTKSWTEMIGRLKDYFSLTTIGQEEYLIENKDEVYLWAGFVTDASVLKDGQYYLVLISLRFEDRGWGYVNATNYEELQVAHKITDSKYIFLCNKKTALKYKKGDFVEYSGKFFGYKDGMIIIQESDPE